MQPAAAARAEALRPSAMEAAAEEGLEDDVPGLRRQLDVAGTGPNIEDLDRPIKKLEDCIARLCN